MGPCLTLIYVLTQPVSLELISLRTFTGVTSWAVNALVLTHVAGEAAFINVLAGDCILCQLVALVTLAEKGANQVVAMVLTGTLAITFIHIDTAVVVAGQLVACVAYTVIRARCVHTSVHAVLGKCALVFVHTVVSAPLIAWRTLAGVGASGVEARLFRATSVSTCRTFIYVFALVLFIYSESSCTADGLSAPMDPRENPWLLRLVWWNRVWWGGLISLLADVDDGALREAEVSTKVVDTLHPSFAGII